VGKRDSESAKSVVVQDILTRPRKKKGKRDSKKIQAAMRKKKREPRHLHRERIAAPLHTRKERTVAQLVLWEKNKEGG